MKDTHFFEKFSKYRPESEEIKQALEGVSDYETERIGGDKKRIKLTLWLPYPVKKSIIYRIEREMAEVYDLKMMKILTKYPQDTFEPEYIHQVITEAEDIGVVSNGFFTDYTYEIHGNKITIYIPFPLGGIRLMECAQTAGIISTIIKSEFGLDFEVSIEKSQNAEHRSENDSEQYSRRKDFRFTASAKTEEVENNISYYESLFNNEKKRML